MYKLGGHLSTAGGYYHALYKTIEIGGNCVQIFSSSPRLWANLNPSPEQIEKFIQVKKELAIDPAYFHATYLINLGDKGYIAEKSVQTLIAELNLASKMGVKGSIIHIGSYKKDLDKSHGEYDHAKVPAELFENLVKNINEVLTKTPEDTFLILENAGTRKIGHSIEELAKIIKAVDNPRVQVCLDTCHAFAAGYDWSTSQKLEAFLKSFDELIGLEKLEVFQVNDSKDTLASFRDRHENIGEGGMGITTFSNLLNHPKLKAIPFILETPGVNKEGPNKENIDRLKRLII